MVENATVKSVVWLLPRSGKPIALFPASLAECTCFSVAVHHLLSKSVTWDYGTRKAAVQGSLRRLGDACADLSQ